MANQKPKIIRPASTDVPPVERLFETIAQTSEPSIWLANFRPNTRRTYSNAVADFIERLEIKSEDDLYNVTQAHVIAFREMLISSGMSNTSVTNRLSTLSSLYKHLADKQLCKSNPVSGVRYPHKGHNGLGSGKTPTLTRKQVRAHLDAPDTSTIQGLRDRALLHVYYYTGKRCSEPSSLRVKDLRMDRGYWILEMTVKGGKTSTVAIHPECQIAIQEYLEASGHGADPSSPLFQAVKAGNNTGGPLTRQVFYHLFMKYARIAGLPEGVTPHSARATFITEAFEAGIAGEDIQRTVDHSSITTTEGYNHSAKRHRKSASFGVNY